MQIIKKRNFEYELNDKLQKRVYTGGDNSVYAGFFAINDNNEF
jgi:hypothetical protein